MYTCPFDLQLLLLLKCFLFWKMMRYTLFFISNTFIRNGRLKLVKNQGKAKEHPQAEFFLLENYLLTPSSLPSRNNKRHSKKITKNKYICLNAVIWLMKKMMKMKKRSHRFDINRPRPTNGHTYTKYKCFSV